MNFLYRYARTISPPSKQLLIYGFFAVLCQLTFLYLFCLDTSVGTSADVLRHVYIPLLEYPFLSLLLLIGGTRLIDLFHPSD